MTAATSRTTSLDNWHPLELFTYFRQWPHSVLRDLLYTFIWNLGVAAIIMSVTLLSVPVKDLGHFVFVNLVMSNSVGYCIHGLFDLTKLLFGNLIANSPKVVRTIYFMLVPVVGVFIGYGIGFTVLDLPGAMKWLFSTSGAKSVAIFSLVGAGIMLAIFTARERSSRNELALEHAKQHALDAERRALESQLRMLQAQIEPHFLYNTLANAVGLIGPAPDKARVLLERLIDYLRASLTSSRQDQTELKRELETLKAYLDLMTVRMGTRLQYQIHLDPALASVSLPPMLLQPLVENAISHGLEPKIDGGEITIDAAKQGHQLAITVTDTGAGFNPTTKPRTGGGVGLANLRDRLQTLYGSAASLVLSDNQPCGVKVTLRIPLQ